MSLRHTKVIIFHISSGTFASKGETEKEANAIKIFLTRLCERENFSCKACIGISQNNPRTGNITLEHTGKRGRPTIVFKRTKKYMAPTTTAWHIHIVMYANPAETICQELKNHLNRKYKKNVVRYRNCKKDIDNSVEYVLKQSIKIRKVESDKEGLLQYDDLGFYAACEAANKLLNFNRISFTYSTRPTLPTKTSAISVGLGFRISKTLPCNTIYKYIIYIQVKNLYYKFKRRILIPP